MGQTERLYRIRQWLETHSFVSPADLQQRLEVSRSTVTRDIRHLRDRLNTPVSWCAERGGYYLDHAEARLGDQYELPGLWLSADEIHALLTMQHLLSHLDTGGLLGPHIQPLRERLATMMDGGVPADAEVARRIRVQTVGARRVHLPHFQALGTALLRRRRAVIDYRGRTREGRTEREVSPQRLVHYRDNWYLDAYCHWRQALRSFSVDAVQAVQLLDRTAIDVHEAELDDSLGAGYGIFAGRPKQWATLRFSPSRARWVAAERWHADQLGRWDHQGNWLLTVPYADPRELVMDILRHVPEVEVVAPDELRAEVAQRMRQALTAWCEILDE